MQSKISHLQFNVQAANLPFYYDGPGMNHLALEVPAQSDVDAAAAYLAERGVPALFGTPRHNPEFSSAERTYYQVMFESPDHILFEIVYMGPKAD